MPLAAEAEGVGALGRCAGADAAGDGCDEVGVVAVPAGERAAAGNADGSGWVTIGADGVALLGNLPVDPDGAPAGFRPTGP
jgi:hypothetical protein